MAGEASRITGVEPWTGLSSPAPTSAHTAAAVQCSGPKATLFPETSAGCPAELSTSLHVSEKWGAAQAFGEEKLVPEEEGRRGLDLFALDFFFSI